jgi:hypothetical protein
MVRLSQAAADTKFGAVDSMLSIVISSSQMSPFQQSVDNLFLFFGGFGSELVPLARVHFLAMDDLACLPESVNA